MSETTVRRIDAAALRARLLDGAELAVLDAREQGAFSRSHLFWCSCVPLSQLELLIGDLVPRRTCPVVWVDGDGAAGGLAARAAQRTVELGWTDVAVLDGGVDGWPGERYSGVNVPSKAFGEWIEREEATPHIGAAALAARQAAGDDLVIVDSRPMREFHRMSIPGGIDCPGAELVYRIHDVAPDPATTVVVNCAGRTRSIIGAQSLRNAGIPNPVVALEHGTMGWELAGLSLAHGETTHAPEPSPAGLRRAQEAAERVAQRFAVPIVDAAAVQAWLADRQRSTFLFDVRTPQEYAAGHAAGARHAPGGQLVQATDEYVGVLGARIVLVDDSLVRAIMTASWLVQLNRYEVAVAQLDDRGTSGGWVTALPPRLGTELGAVRTIDAGELARSLGSVTVIDLAESTRHARGHIPGAYWAVRARLDEAVAATATAAEEAGGPIVLTSPDGELARVAYADAARSWPDVRVLAGGTHGWIAAGHPVEAGLLRPTTEADDAWFKPYDATDVEVARRHMQDYLDWEVALLAQIGGDELVSFRRFPALPAGTAADDGAQQ